MNNTIGLNLSLYFNFTNALSLANTIVSLYHIGNENDHAKEFNLLVEFSLLSDLMPKFS